MSQFDIGLLIGIFLGVLTGIGAVGLLIVTREGK